MALQPEATDDAPQDMKETIAETWKNIQARGVEESAPELIEQSVNSEVKPAIIKTQRDQTGKFAPKTAAEPPPADEPAAAEAAPAEEPAKPKSSFVPKWRKESLEKWGLLPPEVQAEVEKREQDFHRGIEEYKGGAAAAKEWDAAIAPYVPTIKQYGLSPQQATAHLFNIENTLRVGLPQQKLAVIAQLCRDYQVPVQSLFNPQGQMQTPQVDPNVMALHQQLTQIQSQMAAQQQAAQTAQEQELSSQIAKFSAGKEHFETLKPQMAALLQSGMASDLESAYDQAFRVHPVTSQLWIAEQQAKWMKDTQSKAEAARKAAGVTIKPRGTMAPAAGTGTMTDTIRATAQKLGMFS